MVTVVNNPAPSNDSGNGIGMLVGLIVVLAMGYLFFMYGIPALRQMQLGGTQINVPSKIDVNVKQTN